MNPAPDTDHFEPDTAVWARRRHGGITGRAVPCGTWGRVRGGPVRGRYVVAWDNGATTRVHGRHLDTGPAIDPTMADWLETVLAEATPDQAPEAHLNHHPWGPETVDYLRGWDACLATVRAGLVHEGLIYPTAPEQEASR